MDPLVYLRIILKPGSPTVKSTVSFEICLNPVDYGRHLYSWVGQDPEHSKNLIHSGLVVYCILIIENFERS